MVGGIVIETIPYVCGGQARIWINVRGRGSEHRNTCAINVLSSHAARCVSEGDSLWWQGGRAFWTPRVGGFSDYKLARIGFSGASRPEPDEVAATAPAGREGA